MMAELELEVISTADSRGLTQAARDTDKLSGSTATLGHEFREASQDTKDLDKQITSLRTSVKNLGAEFAKTQGASVRKDLRSQRGLLAELERIRKEMAEAASSPLSATLGAAAGDKSGQDFSDGFTRGVAGGMPRMRTVLIAGVVGAIAVLSPMIGAVISGAVTGVAGLGGIAGGIAAASRDSRVRSAARSFSSEISREFFSSGDAFVKPTVEALNTLARSFEDLELGEAFATIAPAVDDLARGIGGLAEGFMPGFRRALVAAGPAIKLLAGELPKIGKAMGDFFGDIAEGEGTLEGLKLLTTLVTGTFRGLGATVVFLTDRFHEFIGVASRVASVMQEQVNSDNPIVQFFTPGRSVLVGAQNIQRTGTSFITIVTGMGDKIKDFGLKAEESRRALGDLQASLMALHAPFLDADRAASDWEQSLDDLTQSVKDNGTSLDIHTQKGRDNKEALRQAAEKALLLRDANIKNGMSMEEADAKYQTQIGNLQTLATKLGLSQSETKKLIDELKKMPRQIVIDVVIRASTFIRSALNSFFQNMPGRQHGGPVSPGESYKVGESGMEILTMGSRGGYVTPMSRARSGSGSAVLQVIGDVDSAFITFLQKLIRTGQITIRAA